MKLKYNLSTFGFRVTFAGSRHKILIIHICCSISLGTSDEGKYNEKIIKLSKAHANQMNINLNHHVSWEINVWTSKDGGVPFLKSPIVTEVGGPAISHTFSSSLLLCCAWRVAMVGLG